MGSEGVTGGPCWFCPREGPCLSGGDRGTNPGSSPALTSLGAAKGQRCGSTCGSDPHKWRWSWRLTGSHEPSAPPSPWQDTAPFTLGSAGAKVSSGLLVLSTWH